MNDSGQNVYVFSIQYDSYQYGNQIITTLVPSSHSGGFTAPSNWVGYPTVSRTPTLEILNNNFGSFLGFTSGLYPALNTTSKYSVNSPITPIGSRVNSVIIRCSLVNNRVGNPMDIIDSFTIGQINFGANINYAPSVDKWVRLSAGTFSNFLITFATKTLISLKV